MVEVRLERPWVDFEEYLAFADCRAFFVVLADDVPRDLRANLSIYVAVQRCHPFAVQRHVMLEWLRNQDFGHNVRNGSIAVLTSHCAQIQQYNGGSKSNCSNSQFAE